MTEKRKRRTFTEEFKRQIVELHLVGKPKAEILREYGLSQSVLDQWIKRLTTTGSSREKDNRTPEQAELLRLQKEVKHLRMENDLLKQVALIFARK